ncbi:hypothetical protein LCA32G_0284 [Lacticaseibacillus paracasei]|nr:hypothetical protein LCA32G_0284 [Lacticaseibacillus paracasei]
MEFQQFHLIGDYGCLTQDVAHSSAGFPGDTFAKRLRIITSADVDWAKENFNDSTIKTQIDTAIFGDEDPETLLYRQSGIFEYNEILKLWMSMNPDQKKNFQSTTI